MKTSYYITLMFFSFIAFSCKKQEDSTQQITKIETNYEGIDPKDESKIIDNSPTTLASEEFIKNYLSEIRKNWDLEKPKNELKSSSGTVGVLKNGSCNGYQTFTIYMDGNDGSNNNAYKTGWTGECTISGGNSTMQFCLVPDQFDYKTGYKYAVLKTSPLSGGHTIERFFDCEDKGNASWVSYNNGVTTLKPFTFNNNLTVTNMTDRGNLDMFLVYYPDTLGYTASFPPFSGLSYGVFGNVNSSYNGLFVTWEEQTNCTNKCYLDGAPITNSAGVPGVDGILTGYTGTNIIMSKVY